MVELAERNRWWFNNVLRLLHSSSSMKVSVIVRDFRCKFISFRLPTSSSLSIAHSSSAAALNLIRRKSFPSFLQFLFIQTAAGQPDQTTRTQTRGCPHQLHPIRILLFFLSSSLLLAGGCFIFCMAAASKTRTECN